MNDVAACCRPQIRPDDAFPWFVNLSVTTRCNLRCAMCASAALPPADLDTDRTLAFLDRLAAWAPMPRQATVTGGEPLLHAGLMPIVARLSRHGFITALATNGVLLTAAKIDELARAGLHKLNLSLDGFSAAHETLRNAPGLFQGVLDAMQYVAEQSDIELNVVTVITARNAAELPAFVKWLADRPRLHAVHFQAVVPTLGLPFAADFFARDPLWPSGPEAVARVLDALAALAELKRAGLPINNSFSQLALWRRYFADPLNYDPQGACRVALDNLMVRADGSIVFCEHYGTIGTIDDEAEAIWRAPNTETLRRRMAVCTQACTYRVNCCYLDQIE
jgi:MoaA/NifB/PqqE/SkfB family radical SAM enzyme